MKKQNPLYLFQSLSVTQIQSQQGPRPDSHSPPQPAQFIRTVDRTPGGEEVCVCVSVGAYMQPQQSLLLHRRRVARESAADEAKHFFHGERQGAQLNIEHLTAGGGQNQKIK